MKEIFNELLTFIYGIAHLIGTGVAKVLGFIFPNIELPLNIIDAIGFLSVQITFAPSLAQTSAISPQPVPISKTESSLFILIVSSNKNVSSAGS